MKKLISGIGVAAILASSMLLALPAQAAAPNWDVSGSWTIAFTCAVGCPPGPYAHAVTLAQTGGSLTGSGSSASYTWVLTSGSVSANTIDFTANYTATADAVVPQTTMIVTGTIAGGTMSGTWTDNYQGAPRSGTWTSTSGTAIAIPIASSTVSVHIFKNVDGVQATAANANSAAFPMLTTFSSTNIGDATDAPFTLSPTGWGGTDVAYEASFNNSNPGADYATHEVTGGAVVGATCADGKPFALAGYSTGSTLSAAQTAGPSATAPNFTTLQADKYVIVWNTTCLPAGEIHGSKFYDVNANGVLNAGEPGLSNWTINRAGTTSGNTATVANGSYAFTSLPAGTYTVTETPQAGWTQTTTSPATIVLGAGQVVNNVDFGNSCYVSTNGHGLGFWTNKNGQAMETAADFTALSLLNLRNADGTDRDFLSSLSQNKTDLNGWLLGATATNMAYMLSAQLTAAKLSTLHGTSGSAQVYLPGLLPYAGTIGANLSPLGVITIDNLIVAANTELGLHADTTSPSPYRAYQEALKNALEKVASGNAVQLCVPVTTLRTFSATDSLYYNGLTPSAGLYGTGPISFSWDPSTGNVTGGLYEEIVPPTTGTHYFNNVVSGTVSAGVVNLTFSRTLPSPYGPFTFTGTLTGSTLTGTLDGPYLFTATGTVTP